MCVRSFSEKGTGGGGIRLKELVRHIYLVGNSLGGSIVEVIRTRGVSSSAASSSASSREARGCESWHGCGPADDE